MDREFNEVIGRKNRTSEKKNKKIVGLVDLINDSSITQYYICIRMCVCLQLWVDIIVYAIGGSKIENPIAETSLIILHYTEA